MNSSTIPYEDAFEDYLRSQGTPYVAVDEHRKAIFAGARVKSFDFLVYRPGRVTWLVDVKGRKFPYDGPGSKRYWENWVTREDLDGLRTWQLTFGEGFQGQFVFTYWLTGPAERHPTIHVHPFRGDSYAFMCVSFDQYDLHCRRRSESWDTFTVPTRIFREIARPIQTIGQECSTDQQAG